MKAADADESRPQGLAVLCRGDGTFIRVLRDDARLLSEVPTSALAGFVHLASREKMLHFLRALGERSAVVGWELNVELPEGITPMQFAGTVTDEGLVVIAARDRGAMMKISEELMGINSDQNTALRAALKELSLQGRAQVERDNRHFDELSQLNNELVTLQRELAQKNHQLARLNQLKNHFLAMASHDLRKPLSVILTNAEFISAESLTSDQAQSVEWIRTAAREVMRSLEDFVDVAQIESGKLKLDLEATDLMRIVRQRLSAQEPLAAAKEIRLQLDAPSALPELDLDPRRMGQAIDNLVENAIKYSPPGSAVSLRAWADPAEVRLSVADEGPGIPAARRSRLFQAFGTAGSQTTGGEKSTGLGLAIVRAIVRQHGGDVWLEDGATRGARFVLSLPVPAR